MTREAEIDAAVRAAFRDTAHMQRWAARDRSRQGLGFLAVLSQWRRRAD